MDLDRSLLKEFAKVVNDVGDKPEPKQYVYGTVTTGAGNTKCVMLDGSDMLTPISEVVNAEAGDRVLVSVSSHQATVIGNITFPPSARKEQQAIDSANGALEQSNQAIEKANDAQTKANSAITDSSVASALANEAKTESAKAKEDANTAIQNADEAKQLAQASSNKSDETQQLANQVKDSVNAANKDIGKLKAEVKTANDNIAIANTILDTQAGEIATIKETYSTKVETENAKADLTTEISKKVGELQTSVENNFSTKTENVALEQKLQTQITQNANSISSTVTKVEKLESDTTEQQKNIDKALQDAQNANTAAGVAKSEAEKAKTAADTAKKAADDATAKAESATTAANLAEQKVTAADKQLQQAKTDLAEAQENLNNVTSRVDATEQEIADAKQKVETANANVTKALTDVAEAKNDASKANEIALRAQSEATAANNAASDAQTKAANAQQVATNAQQAADKAQSDLAALTNRVTTAETNITQTNEAITTQANRITETSNKINDIQNDISNNYYSKEQTDAQIKVSADNISQTVIETNKVVTSANKNATDALNKANSLTDRANSGEFDGRGVKNTTVEYQASTSGTTVPTGAWSTTIPSVAAGSYLWTKTTTNYTSGSPTIGYSVARMGVNGAKGDVGATGSSVILAERESIYSFTLAQIKAKPGTIGDWSSFTNYSSMKVGDIVAIRVAISDVANSEAMLYGKVTNISGSTVNIAYTSYMISGQDGEKGDKGDTGADGKGIKSTAITYQAWSNGTSTPTGAWSSSPPATSASKPYLWTRTIITYTDNSTSTSYSVGSTPEGIVVGGRNLLIGSKSGIISNQLLDGSTALKYGDATLDGNPCYCMSGPRYIKINFPTLKVGEQYIFSCDVARQSGGTSQDVFISIGESTVKVGIASVGIWTNFNVTFTASDASTYALVRVNNASSSGISDWVGHTRHFKLEIGNKATDWTPAPEDQEQYVDNKIAASEKATEESYKTLINQTANDISTLVQKVQKETDANSTSISEISTNFKVTAEGLSATKSAVQTLIDAVNGTVSKEELQQYIRWNGGDLELGNSVQPFRCKLSNTELAFYQNEDKVAWISNKELYILKAIIAQSIGCGNFMFIDEGDLGFSLI